MAVQLFTNNAASTLSGTLTQGGTTMVLATGEGSRFPAPTGGDYFLLTLFEKDVSSIEFRHEIVKVTARTGDTLTIERDFENMTGSAGGYSYPSVGGATVYCELRWTAAGAGNLLQASDNLAGLSDPALARTNLGIGSVIVEGDARLTNSRPASDVYAWAKAATKPTYTATEVGAATTADLAGKLNSTNPSITGSVTEDVYNLTGTVIDPANGTVQYATLTGNTTFTESIADGQAVTLMVNPATYSITWPTITWVSATGNTAPTLTASVYNCITLFQFGGTLYGKFEGHA